MAERIWFRPKEGVRVWIPFAGRTVFPPEGAWTELTPTIRKMIETGDGQAIDQPPESPPPSPSPSEIPAAPPPEPEPSVAAPDTNPPRVSRPS